MLEQNDWTFKLFLHNFFKENNLKNTLQSFENEVFHTSNFNQELPIKSNKTFLLEMWNIFYHLFSGEVMKDFISKNTSSFEAEMLNTLKFTELFNKSTMNFAKILPQPATPILDSNNFNPNLHLMSTIENFKNLSRSYGMNFINPNINPLDIQGLVKNFTQNQNNINSMSSFQFPPIDLYSNLNKYNTENSSLISSEKKNPIKIVDKFQKKFNCSISSKKNSSNHNELINKKRKRYIKNNKFVYVHPGSAAAKRLELEKQQAEEKMKKEVVLVDTQVKMEEKEEESLPEINVNNVLEENDLSDSNSNKGKKPRGSRYRGVSRNGNQWQVLIMVNKKKRYVGSYSNEDEAARAYDKVALQNHGTKAKTNFDYIDEEVKKILKEPPLLKLY